MQHIDFEIRQFASYFPQVQELIAPKKYLRESSEYLNIEFVASSLPIDNTIHSFLLKCDQ